MKCSTWDLHSHKTNLITIETCKTLCNSNTLCGLFHGTTCYNMYSYACHACHNYLTAENVQNLKELYHKKFFFHFISPLETIIQSQLDDAYLVIYVCLCYVHVYRWWWFLNFCRKFQRINWISSGNFKCTKLKAYCW